MVGGAVRCMARGQLTLYMFCVHVCTWCGYVEFNGSNAAMFEMPEKVGVSNFLVPVAVVVHNRPYKRCTSFIPSYYVW